MEHMDMTQPLIPHAGKMGREIQGPIVDADRQSEQLGQSFGIVFATHEMRPDHKGGLQFEVQGDVSTEPVGDASDLVVQMEPESGRLREAKQDVADELKRPDQMQAELSEAMLLMPVVRDLAAHESTDASQDADAYALAGSKIEIAWSSQDPIHQAATVDEAFDRSTSSAEAPKVYSPAPSQLLEISAPTVRNSPANRVPAANADITNELLPKASKSLSTSEEPRSTRGTGALATEQVDLPLARLDTVFLAPDEPAIEAQNNPAQHPLPVSGPTTVLSNRLAGVSPRRGTEMQVETGRPTPESTVDSNSLGTPMIKHPHVLAPASGIGDQLQSVPKTVEDPALTDPISNTIQDTNQTAARAVELHGNGTDFVPVSTQAATFPFGAAPLVQVLEGEVGQQFFDDAGFRMVEQLSATTGDLKTSAFARPAELPRITLVQIADVVRQQPDRPVELTLSPEELGRLRMSFQSEGSSMHVTLSFERPDTLDLMRRHIDQLAQDLRASGMSEVSFTFQQQTSDGGGGASPNGETTWTASEQHSDPSAASDDDAPIVLNIESSTGVDIRV